MHFSSTRRRNQSPLFLLSLLLPLCVWIMAMTPTQANAAAPQVRTQGPGFYRMMLGDFEITALLDGTHPFPIDKVMTEVSGEDITRDLARDSLNAPVQGSINAS